MQYCGNCLKSAAVGGFAGIMKVTNHEELWDDELAWHSLSTTDWICHYGLDWNTASEYTILGLPDLVWLLRFL